jgi:3-hydroxyisobutyrate dehydrogenase-like beta-hydroxyacid dehydrogenase
MNVGFLGLGLMGSGIARNLLAARHDLIVWNRSPGKAVELEAAGAHVASSVAEASEGREVVVTMLANDEALDAVADELIAALAPGAMHLVMGTHSVETVRRLAARHAEAGQELVAAPVIGRPQVAAAGELGIMAAGSPEAVARCTPLFEAAGRQTFDAGTDPVGAAVMKLANNFALACAVEAMAETFALVRAYGISPQAMQDVFVNGMFKGSSVYTGYGQRMVDEAYVPAGFRTVLALKDIDLIRAAAESKEVPLPSADVCRETIVAAIEHGEGERDWAVIARERARAAGLE